MGIVFRQSSRTTFMSYVGVAIGYVNVLWIFPAVLSPEEIGLLRLLPSLAFLILPFTQLGLSQSILKFFPQFEEGKRKNELLSLMLLANLAGFGLTLILFKVFETKVFAFFHSKSPLANEYIHVSVILVFILSYLVIFESFAKSILKIVFPGIVRDVIIRVLYTILVGIYFFGLISINQLVNSLILIYGMALGFLVTYVLKKGSLKASLSFQRLTWSRVKPILNFSFFALLGASGNYIILNIDQAMISNVIGLKGNGIYTTAFYIAIIIEMPRRAISNITTPLVSKLFKENLNSEVNQLYKKVSINQTVVGTLFLLGILTNVDTLFAMIPNNETYRAGINVVTIIGIAKIVDMIFGINSEIIVMSKYYRYNVLFTIILAVVAIVSNWLLIRKFGIDGAALATGITLVIFNITKLIFLRIKMDLWPFTWNNLIVVMIGLATYYIVLQIPVMGNLWTDLVLRSVIVTIMFSLPCLLLRVSTDINNVLSKIRGFEFLASKS